MGTTLTNLAITLDELNRPEEAARAYLESLAHNREISNRWDEAMALGNYAHFLERRGQLEKSLTVGQQALALNREISNRRSEGVVLGNLAGLYAKLGRTREAEAAFVESLAIHEETCNRPFLVLHGLDFAIALVQSGKLQPARSQWGESIRRWQLDSRKLDLRVRLEAMRHACALAGLAPFDFPGELGAPGTAGK